jgi:hypothetical protein
VGLVVALVGAVGLAVGLVVALIGAVGLAVGLVVALIGAVGEEVPSVVGEVSSQPCNTLEIARASATRTMLRNIARERYAPRQIQLR